MNLSPRAFLPAAALLALAVVIPGCSSGKPGQIPDVGTRVPAPVQSIFEKANSFEIHALHPSPYTEEGKPTPDTDFHGYKILASSAVDLPSERDAIIRTVYEGILANDGMVAACFNPRHGIRATKGSESVDFVICYECLSMLIFDAAGNQTQALTTSEQGQQLTRIWKSYGLSIHKGH